MAFKLHGRILETFITEGTGTITLAGAVSGYKTFASEYSNGDTCHYFMEGGADFEEGYATYSGVTLARTEILDSSNGGSAVDWAAGTKTVGIAPLGPSDLDGANMARLHGAMGIKTFKNLLHNGGFQVAQRGDGPFTSASAVVNNDDAYLLDGCIFLANGSDTCDVSRVTDTDFVSGKKIRLDVETNNRRFGVLFPIESAVMQAVRKSGKASVQFKVKRTGTSLANVRAYLLAWSSTADAITSDVISAWGSAAGDPTFVANWTAENTASQLAVGTTIATHRIENISVDTASIANLALLIISDPTTTTAGDFLDIGDVQVEEGAHATEYEHRPIQVDMALCQRYLEPISNGTSYGLTAFLASTALARAGHQFRVTKRAAPTLLTPILANINVNSSAGNNTATSVSLLGADTYGCAFDVGVSGTPFTTGQAATVGISTAPSLVATSEL